MIRQTNKLQGVDVVMRNLNRELDIIGNKSMRALIKAAILIRRDMDITPPVIPVDKGNLRASSFVVAGTGVIKTSGAFFGPDAAKFSAEHTSVIAKEKVKVARKKLVAIGLSASYAGGVEADTTTKRKRPGSGGGFFESSISRNKKAIIKLIKKDAKIR